MQDLRKIVVISPMRNRCSRFATGCAYFPNTQYMWKICARLCLIPQCAIFGKDLRKIVLISPNAQYMCMICARFVQDCTYFPNV